VLQLEGVFFHIFIEIAVTHHPGCSTTYEIAGAIWSSLWGTGFVMMSVERMLDCEWAGPNAKGLKIGFLSQSYLDFTCGMYVQVCHIIQNNIKYSTLSL
jgi:hypothetical protein